MIDTNYSIVSSTAGSTYYVRVLSTLDREKLKPNTSIALHRHSHSVVDILPPESDSSIQLMMERPDVTYHDIGGLDIQKQEVREAVELPLTHFELYKQIGIDPPRGVLMYGPPGTGKTMMAKAVANATTASFINVVGSEFVQKYLGEGPRMVLGNSTTTRLSMCRSEMCSAWRARILLLWCSSMKLMLLPRNASTRKLAQTEKCSASFSSC